MKHYSLCNTPEEYSCHLLRGKAWSYVC